MKFTKKRLTGLLAVVVVAAIGVTSLAIFTDRSQSTATAKAGSLDLQLTQDWAGDNETALSHFAPGDILDLNYTLTNDSTLAAKVREKFVITSDKAIPADTFQIWVKSDLVKSASGLWAPADDTKSPVATLNDSTWAADKYATYTLPQFVLDGDHDDQKGFADRIATPNTDASDDDMIYANNSELDHYVILFNKNAVNSVGGAKITVKYMAEAMQHLGTGAEGNADKWAVVADAEYTFLPGVEKAVPTLDFNPRIPTNP